MSLPRLRPMAVRGSAAVFARRLSTRPLLSPPVAAAGVSAAPRRQSRFSTGVAWSDPLRSSCGGCSALRAGARWGSNHTGDSVSARKDGELSATELMSVDSPFCVVNFYHLHAVEAPEDELQRHRDYIEQAGLDIKGRIYISSQGINAQYSAPRKDALEYAHWVAGQEGFDSIRWHLWDIDTHQFPKLRMKVRKSLVQLAGGTTSLPLLDRERRAKPLQPSEWRRMLAESKPVVLDVRNNYEWDAGHFQGAARPVEENFCDTPTDLPGEAEEEERPAEALPQYLETVDKDAPVMMYCTGGIRCDIYSAYLQKHIVWGGAEVGCMFRIDPQGFKQLYTLEGGIANYLNQEGTDHWTGSLFVFDDRLAIGPVTDVATGEEQLMAATDSAQPLPAAVPCQLCRSAQAVLPHANCANVMCNKLFIACDACRQAYSNCCCDNCTRAPRLRYRQRDGVWVEQTQDPSQTMYRPTEAELNEIPINHKSRSRVVDYSS